MRDNANLPAWLTGLTAEEARARDLQNQPASGANPPVSHDELAWLDELIDAPEECGVAPAQAAQPPQLRALTQRQPPRVTRISSTPAAPAAPTPAPASAPTSRISSAPLTASGVSELPGRFAFRRLPAWWDSDSGKRRRSAGALPAWLRK